MKVGALFCGIGGFCKGFEKNGIQTTWAVDNDEKVAMTYRANYPNTEFHLTDVRELADDPSGLEPVDILHAGFPCQSFSSAGDRKGFDDERGMLFFDLIRLISNMGKARPKILIFENSPYLQIGNRGEWFRTVKLEIQKAGYWFKDGNALVLDPRELCSSPQFRPRLFMIAFSREAFRSGRLPTLEGVDAIDNSLEEIIDFDGEKDDRYYLAPDNKYFELISKMRVKEKQRLYQLRKYLVRVKEHCPTLTANMGLGGHNVPFVFDQKGIRKLTEQECLKMQGFYELVFPEEVPSWSRYHQIGNAVNVFVAESLARALLPMVGGVDE